MGEGSTESVHGEPIAAETLWSCTTCGACADVCPLGISPMRMITDMRRFLIGEGALRGSPAAALQKTDRAGNPWGLPITDRMAWAAGLDVPLASAQREFDVLYWVGCAAAYDRRVQKVARSVVRLLQAANVNFAVLGPEERCTGESARRMGDELLFQQLAAQNVETLSRRGVRRIVAHCPHCVNSLRNDYPQVGGNYEVVHHSQLLAELVREGRLAPKVENNSDRGTVDVPRSMLPGSRERHHRAAASRTNGKCGWFEWRQSSSSCRAIDGTRPAAVPAAAECGSTIRPHSGSVRARVREIAESGAGTVAVSCPFCLIMLGDGLAAQKPDVHVRDIAEVLAESVLGPESPA